MSNRNKQNSNRSNLISKHSDEEEEKREKSGSARNLGFAAAAYDPMLLIEEEKIRETDQPILIRAEQANDSEGSSSESSDDEEKVTPEEVSQVFGSDRFPPASLLYLSKNSILQDLVSKKRAFAKKAAQSKNGNSMIDKVDLNCPRKKNTK